MRVSFLYVGQSEATLIRTTTTSAGSTNCGAFFATSKEDDCTIVKVTGEPSALGGQDHFYRNEGIHVERVMEVIRGGGECAS